MPAASCCTQLAELSRMPAARKCSTRNLARCPYRRSSLQGENAAVAHGLNLRAGLVGCDAPVGIDARLAKLHPGGEAGGAQHLPQVGRETLVAIPAQLPLLDAAVDRVADGGSGDGRSNGGGGVNEPGVKADHLAAERKSAV